MDHRLGQVQLRLRESDELDGPGRGIGHHQGQGIGLPYVLAGQDHQSPGDEPGVLARLEHPGQPVEAGVGIRPPDRLDEGADLVVVVVLAVVVEREWRARSTMARVTGWSPARAMATSRVIERGPGIAVGQADERDTASGSAVAPSASSPRATTSRNSSRESGSSRHRVDRLTAGAH